MAGKTTIEWTHAPGYIGGVWNPTTGCTRVSAGCDNCYAFSLHDRRYAGNLNAAKRLSGTGLRVSPAGARVDFPEAIGVKRGLSRAPQYDLPFSRVQMLEDRLDVPLRTKKPTCYFVDSMADLFHEDVPDDYLFAVFGRIAAAHWHRFLILTKRPERMQHFVSHAIDGHPELADRWPLPNVWLGTSVEDQRSADERIPHLLATPAAVRFLSCEPLLGPVDLDLLHMNIGWNGDTATRGIDWVIVGGESGSRARPMDLAWARSLVQQCRAAGIAPFVKQMGSHWFYDEHAVVPRPKSMREPHGRDPGEWPEDLRIREWPR